MVPNFKNQAIFRRICLESLKHSCGNILPTICTNILIFGKDTFLVLICRMILTNPIKSQIFIFVTSHFTTLWSTKTTWQCGLTVSELWEFTVSASYIIFLKIIISRVFTDLLSNSPKRSPRLSPGYEGMENMFCFLTESGKLG